MMIGHNNPPNDLDLLKDRLQRDYQAVAETLEGMEKSFSSMTYIKNEDDAAEVTDFLASINKIKKDCEAMHKGEKETFLRSGQAVDGFFKQISGRIDALKIMPAGFLNVWMKKKQEEERARREAEAKRLREEAEEKIRVAVSMEKAEMIKEAAATIKQAIVSENKAAKYEESVQSGAGLAMSRGGSGSASMRTTWVGHVTDFAQIDLEALRGCLSREVIEQAVGRFVRDGGRELRGAVIEQKTTTVVR